MLIVYIKDNCRYSERVLEAIDRLNLEVEIRNKSTDPLWTEELEKIQGFAEVPFLVDTDTSQHVDESEDIVSYLEKNYGSSASGAV